VECAGLFETEAPRLLSRLEPRKHILEAFQIYYENVEIV